MRYAFEYARSNGRKRVTAVHKANIMKHTDGLYLAMARRVAEQFPDIEFEDRIVDNMCMQLVQKPELYDVLVLPNLYGDILSDLAAGLVGGLGVAPGANIGTGGAVFEATHGSAPKYKGQNKVNPTALILSAVLMLHHLGEREAGDRLERAVAAIIAEGKRRDLRHEARSQRPNGRRHPRDGRGHLPPDEWVTLECGDLSPLSIRCGGMRSAANRKRRRATPPQGLVWYSPVDPAAVK